MDLLANVDVCSFNTLTREYNLQPNFIVFLTVHIPERHEYQGNVGPGRGA